MLKADLVKTVSDKSNVPQYVVKEVIDKLRETVYETVKSGEGVKIMGLVTFEIKERRERKGKTYLGADKGKEWVVPAHREVVARISKKIKNCCE
jgi:DNA-binding protein HU-beta